jgi:hypothetical protein
MVSKGNFLKIATTANLPNLHLRSTIAAGEMKFPSASTPTSMPAAENIYSPIPGHNAYRSRRHLSLLIASPYTTGESPPNFPI